MIRVIGQFLLGILAIRLTTSNTFAETNTVTSGAIVSTNILMTPTNFAQLLALPPEQLDKVDIALMNLLCTEGLPGTKGMNVPQLLKTLDSWVEWIRINTERHRYRFESDPKFYNNSEGDFRMAILSATLQQQYGVLYDPARAEAQLRGGPYAESDEVFFANPNSIFISGLLTGRHYGTCSSMPMLYVAIAQRLGYPVHLAKAKLHYMVRYDEGIRHFYVEATSPGYAVYGDDHYRTGPLSTTEDEIKKEHLFESMNGCEVLAACLESRSACFNAIGDFEKAREATLAALKLVPTSKYYQGQADWLTAKIENKRKAIEWDKLLAEMQKIVPPEGRKLNYFRDKKIELQIYLFETADLGGTEKRLKVLKEELAAEKPVDAPAQIDLASVNPPQHPSLQIVVMPAKAQYVTIDGQTNEIIVKSPDQVAEFLVEQRVLDKLMERQRMLVEIAAGPQQAATVQRPASIRIKPRPEFTREAALKKLEAELDKQLPVLREELKDIREVNEANEMNRRYSGMQN